MIIFRYESDRSPCPKRSGTIAHSSVDLDIFRGGKAHSASSIAVVRRPANRVRYAGKRNASGSSIATFQEKMVVRIAGGGGGSEEYTPKVLMWSNGTREQAEKGEHSLLSGLPRDPCRHVTFMLAWLHIPRNILVFTNQSHSVSRSSGSSQQW